MTSAGPKSDRFRTAPGGGKNRASGGRIAAAAYVSPLTLPSEPLAKQPAQPFKIDTGIKKQVAQFGTEPSFFRSQQAPKSLMTQQRRLTLLVALIFFSLGAALAWHLSSYFIGVEADRSPGVPLTEKKVKNFGNQALESSNTEIREEVQQSADLLEHSKSALNLKESSNKKPRAKDHLFNKKSKNSHSRSPEKKNENPTDAKALPADEPNEPQVQQPSRELWLQ